MPKRPEMARMRAAVAAGDPPASAGYANDDGWHAAQDDWLSKWRRSEVCHFHLEPAADSSMADDSTRAGRAARVRRAANHAGEAARSTSGDRAASPAPTAAALDDGALQAPGLFPGPASRVGVAAGGHGKAARLKSGGLAASSPPGAHSG